MKFELILDCALELIETPIWDGRIGKLYWTDLFSGDVHRYDPKTGGDEVWRTNQMIGSAIPCDELGKVLCVLENGVHILDLESGTLEFLADAEPGNTGNRCNDSRVDAAGRLFLSTVSKLYGTDKYHPELVGGFYMLDTNRKSIVTLVEGIQQYNAIVWTKDNSRMYVVDTYHEKLVAFPYSLEKGPAGGPENVVDFSPYGMPDGMCIDQEDTLYVFHWSGRITVWNKKLQFVREIPFPVEYACCGGFGGSDNKTLFAATSKFGYTPEQLEANKGAGGLFAAHCQVAGRNDYFYKI